VVPGNHDVDWTASMDGDFRAMRTLPESAPPLGAVSLGTGHVVPTPRTLERVTLSFRQGYENFFGVRYSHDPGRRAMYLRPPGLNLGVVAIDTTIGMHHLNDSPAVDRQALITALEEARAEGERRLIIAVGHHGPVRKPGQNDAIDSWVFDELLDAGVRLYLHGHVHETQLYTHSRDGFTSLTCIGVGSLVAGPVERPESSPRYYHLVELPHTVRSGRVLVRRKDRRDLPWKRDQLHGPRAAPVDYLVFSV